MLELKKLNTIKQAFTMSEVLITLGIIGVIAAITLPSLVNKYKEMATVAQLKKTYSILNQALMFAVAENGDSENWDVPSGASVHSVGFTPTLYEYIIPYLKVAKKCDKTNYRKACFAEKYKTYMPNNPRPDIDKTSAGNGGGYDLIEKYAFVLADGTAVQPEANLHRVVFYVDINGPKPPNHKGVDFFVFIYYANQTKNEQIVSRVKNGILLPLGTIHDCYYNYGGSCTALAVKGGDMQYLRLTYWGYIAKHKMVD